jgi:hypothetical protein
VRAGAEPLDFTRDVAWMSPYGWYVRFPGDLVLLASTRDLISPQRTPLRFAISPWSCDEKTRVPRSGNCRNAISGTVTGKPS